MSSEHTHHGIETLKSEVLHLLLLCLDLFLIECFHSLNDFWCIHLPQHGVQCDGIVRIKLIRKVESILKDHIQLILVLHRLIMIEIFRYPQPYLLEQCHHLAQKMKEVVLDCTRHS